MQAEAIFEGALVINRRKYELEPGNTTYRRDLSISYNRLADLALAAGRSGDAEALYRRALQVRQELTELEPGNTTYRRDLSISYNRLADLALRSGQLDSARGLIDQAVDGRRGLHLRESHRLDFAVELAYALYLGATISAAEAKPDVGQAKREEIADLLDPFEAVGLLDARGSALLSWSRE